MAAAGELHSPVSCSSEPDDSMEPYTTERLSRLPGGYKPLTEPFTALNIDFNNVQVMRADAYSEIASMILVCFDFTFACPLSAIAMTRII